MGTPRPHVSRHVSGRAPRRGRRPRRPVFCSPIAGCTRVLHVCLRRPYFFQQRKKYGKERRQKPSVFGFPFRPIVTAVQKGSAPDRLHSYPRCRSCVPRENFLLSRRTEKVLYILHTFIFCGPKGRTYAAVGKSGSLRRAKCPRPAPPHKTIPLRQSRRGIAVHMISKLVLVEDAQDLVEGLIHLVLGLLALHLIQRLQHGLLLRLCLRSPAIGGDARLLLLLVEAGGDIIVITK